MKTLPEQILLYDKDCPLCAAYSSAFVSFHMLDKDGRVHYGDASSSVASSVDMTRARNEIALLDRTTGTVTYGMDSLLSLIRNRFPFLAFIGSLPVLHHIFSVLYAFISYNRRIIMPRYKKASAGTITCDPDRHIPYRLAFISCITLATCFILNAYFTRFGLYIPFSKGVLTELFISLGQLFTMGSMVFFINRHKVLDYLGYNVVISFAGALLLLIPILLKNYLSEWIYFSLLFPVLGWMTYEHIRRLKLLGLSPYLTLIWIGYRAALLAAFLFIHYCL